MSKAILKDSELWWSCCGNMGLETGNASRLTCAVSKVREHMPIIDPASPVRCPPDSRLSDQAIVQRLTPYLSPRRRRRIDASVRQRLISVTLVLEDPYDPHNGAAALRSAEAFGLLNVHIVTQAAFRFSRKVTQHAHKWLNIYVHRSIEDCAKFLRDAGFALWAAAPPALGTALAPMEVPIDRPIALLFGNEHRGLSRQAMERCDGCFHLPMHGLSESLNLSVSVAVALNPVVQMRRMALGRPGDLPPWAVTRLQAAYYVRSTRHAVSLLSAMVDGPER